MKLISIIYRNRSISDDMIAELKRLTARTVTHLTLDDTSIMVFEKREEPSDELMMLMVELGKMSKDVTVGFSDTNEYK